MKRPILYIGTDEVSWARQLDKSMLSVNRLMRLKNTYPLNSWIMDSGAFTRITRGKAHLPIPEYAEQVHKWSGCGTLEVVVCQDYMCEPFVLAKTGLSIREHQELTTANYVTLRAALPDHYVMPVLQGWNAEDYVRHLETLAPFIDPNAWVGVGSVCKRQSRPSTFARILKAILQEGTELRLHGFGVKTTALRQADISESLYSVDSMSWSYAGRFENPPRTHSLEWCQEWAERTRTCPVEPSQIALI